MIDRFDLAIGRDLNPVAAVVANVDGEWVRFADHLACKAELLEKNAQLQNHIKNSSLQPEASTSTPTRQDVRDLPEFLLTIAKTLELDVECTRRNAERGGVPMEDFFAIRHCVNPDVGWFKEQISILRQAACALGTLANGEKEMNVACYPLKPRSSETIVAQTNALAREMYRIHGCEVAEGYRFDKSIHPQERKLWACACAAQEELTETNPDDAVADMEDGSNQPSVCPDCKGTKTCYMSVVSTTSKKTARLPILCPRCTVPDHTPKPYLTSDGRHLGSMSPFKCVNPDCDWAGPRNETVCFKHADPNDDRERLCPRCRDCAEPIPGGSNG